MKNDEKVFTNVHDYLFSKEYIVLEDKSGKRLIFRSERGNITLSFSNKVEISKSDIRLYYYEKSELDDNYDEDVPFDSNDDMSDEIRLKLHYTIQ